jgi:PTS system nitrogen regulatory IIA component
MDFSDILVPEAVKVVSGVKSKKRLFQELGDVISMAYGFDSDAALQALQDREALGPTGVGNGIALPHARIEGIDRVVGAFIRLEKPLDFDAVDRQQVDLIMALFAPEDAGVEHLKALALVSRTLRGTGLCSKLRANGDPATLHTLLTETESSQAA